MPKPMDVFQKKRSSRHMLKAVLLDLDNTLVLYDEPAYYQRYFKALVPHFEDLFSGEELVRRLLTATAALQENAGQEINLRYFLKAFADGDPPSQKNIWTRFEGFYQQSYGRFGHPVAPPRMLHKVIDGLKAIGLKLVVATNPMFPLIALEKRMAWVGLERNDFELVTHMENMRYVKPNPGYFLQICEMVAVNPGNCLMVGNDLTNDMAAGLAGLKTYHTLDTGEIDYSAMRIPIEKTPSRPTVPPPDYSGPFSGVLDLINNQFEKPV